MARRRSRTAVASKVAATGLSVTATLVGVGLIAHADDTPSNDDEGTQPVTTPPVRAAHRHDGRTDDHVRGAHLGHPAAHHGRGHDRRSQLDRRPARPTRRTHHRRPRADDDRQGRNEGWLRWRNGHHGTGHRAAGRPRDDGTARDRAAGDGATRDRAAGHRSTADGTPAAARDHGTSAATPAGHHHLEGHDVIGPPATHLCFRAMSTDVGITVVGGDPGLSDWAHRRVAELEQRWSRFRPDSEINKLNHADGMPVEVSPETVGAVRAACAAWAFTGGCFDPTVHDSLVRLGYDDSIDAVRARGAGHSDVVPAPPIPAPGCTGIVYDESASVVQLPVGVRLDLGGIGKGLAADDVATGLMARGAAGALVNIGGDLRVIGSPSASAAWRVELEDPRTEQVCAAVELLDGGVATSTTLRRRWRMAGVTRHHLVDPARGTSTDGAGTAVVGVSVVAGTAAWADALSKVPFVDPLRAVEAFGAASALVIHDDGTIRAHGPLQFLRAVPA